MTTETTVFVFKETGAQDVQNKIRGIGQASKDAAPAADALRGALAAIAGALALNKLKEYADVYASIEGRLRIVTKTTEELRKTQADLLRISNSTRQSFEGTAGLYSKLAIQTKALRIDQSRLLSTVETVNQAIVISGASGQEARGGLIQFAQGLSSGRLQGEELRSVLENLPRLASAIANGLGVNIGQLRELGAAGKLTTTAVLDAIKKEAPKIAEEFKKMPVTISQAFTVLENVFLNFVGQTSQTSGFVKILTDGIFALANIMPTLANGLLVAAAAFLSFKAVGILTAIPALLATAAGAAAPFAILVGAIALAATWALTFGANVKVAEGSTTTWKDVVMTAYQVLKDFFTPALRFAADNVALITKGLIAFAAVFVTYALVKTIMSVVGAVIALGRAMVVLNALLLKNPLVLLAVVAAGLVLTFTDLGASVTGFGAQAAEAFVKSNDAATKSKVEVEKNRKAVEDLINKTANVGPAAEVSFGQAKEAIKQGTDATQTWVDTFKDLGRWIVEAINKLKEYFTFSAQAAPGGNAAVDDGGRRLPGFATGGQFTVGGSGGTDSQIVAFRATPGEQVSIKTPGQQMADGGITVQTPGFNALGNTTESGFRALNDNVAGGLGTVTRSLGTGFTAIENATSGFTDAIIGDVGGGLKDVRSSTISVGGRISGAVVDLNPYVRGTDTKLGTANSTLESIDSGVNQMAAAYGYAGAQVAAGGGGGFDTSGGGGGMGGGGGGTNRPPPSTATGTITQIQTRGGTWADVNAYGAEIYRSIFAALGSNDAVWKFYDQFLRKSIGGIDFSSTQEDLAFTMQKLAQYDAFRKAGSKAVGFARGGSFMVGGAPGPDQNLAMMRLTRGEQVDIRTKRQQAEMGKPAQVIKVELIVQGVTDADSFRRSEVQIAQSMENALARVRNKR